MLISFNVATLFHPELPAVILVLLLHQLCLFLGHFYSVRLALGYQLYFMLFAHLHASEVRHLLEAIVGLLVVLACFLVTLLHSPEEVLLVLLTAHVCILKLREMLRIDPVRMTQRIVAQSHTIVALVKLCHFLLRLIDIHRIFQTCNRCRQQRKIVIKVLVILLQTILKHFKRRQCPEPQHV